MATYRHPQLQLNDGIDIPELMAHVEVLQQWLKNWGILPSNSKVDGKFGPNTKASVERFQSLRQTGNQFVLEALQVTGTVDQKTWAELLKVPLNEIEILPRPSVDVLSKVDGFDIDRIINEAVLVDLRPIARRTIPLILMECKANGVLDRGQIAYILATAEHESHLGNLMTEMGGEQYFRRMYDPTVPPDKENLVARDLGNTEIGDGPRYRGRGFVQITGRRNYTDWAERLSIDLVKHPEQTTIPRIAAKILVIGMQKGTFTGARLGQHIAGETQNFEGARNIVNPGDRREHIKLHRK
jgi:hypothetical protein